MALADDSQTCNDLPMSTQDIESPETAFWRTVAVSLIMILLFLAGAWLVNLHGQRAEDKHQQFVEFCRNFHGQDVNGVCTVEVMGNDGLGKIAIVGIESIDETWRG